MMFTFLRSGTFTRLLVTGYWLMVPGVMELALAAWWIIQGIVLYPWTNHCLLPFAYCLLTLNLNLNVHFLNYDLLHHIPLLDLIDNIEPLIHLPEYRMLPVQVAGVVAAVANEEL